MEFLISILLVIILAGLFYFAVSRQARLTNEVTRQVMKQATERYLDRPTIIHPDNSHWKYSPFEREIKIGTFGFYGIPSNEEYYRIVSCQDNETNTTKFYWVKAIHNRKTRTMSFEWREETTRR